MTTIEADPLLLAVDSTTGVDGQEESGAATAQQNLLSRFPPRPVETQWSATTLDRCAVIELVGSASTVLPAARIQRDLLHRGLPLLLDWLEDQTGPSWQQRWLASGADAAGEDWARGPGDWLECHGKYSENRLALMTSSLLVMVGADAVRPSLRWLLTGGKKRKVTRNMIRGRDPEGFEQLRQVCDSDPDIAPLAHMHTAFRCAVIIAAKGGMLADITVGDVLEVLDAEIDLRGQRRSGSITFKVLQQMGVFGPEVPSLRELLSVGQRSVEELIGRYPIACHGIRDLLVDYFKERQASIDYGTLRSQTSVLARSFWLDIEAHHPGIDSLNLPRDVASAWKRRIRTKTTTTRTATGETVSIDAERLSCLDIMATVRAFYLDLSQWALEDPARWGPWVAPCPIRADEMSRRKQVRQRKARMDARTRDRLPVLPILVRAADQWRRDAETVLAAARQTPPGEQFTAADRILVRSARPHAVSTSVWVTDPLTGKDHPLHREEEHAFWAWAVIEVLRLSGVRVEELLELSHYSLVQYRLPTTGELIPLLQIAPSKTDTERLLVVSPELADVLSTIIRRIRDKNGMVPLVRARDYHEHIWLPPSPLLFQRRQAAENRALTINIVSDLLDEALAHTGLVEADGSPLHYTPHDFRRMFITDAVMNGLPPHIAQVIAGHRNINVTMGYKAVYPEEAIQAHLGFLARRRALRPSEEYRTPTDEEWQEFLGHFERRKVSIGTCARAFGTPCIHEHACVRCPMLWPDPAQHQRLVEICDNLQTRIAEAEREGWLGEVEGLQVSLAGAQDKLAQIDKRDQSVEVAMPTPRSLTSNEVQ